MGRKIEGETAFRILLSQTHLLIWSSLQFLFTNESSIIIAENGTCNYQMGNYEAVLEDSFIFLSN